jgi:hypothetical protein
MIPLIPKENYYIDKYRTIELDGFGFFLYPKISEHSKETQFQT